MKMGFLFLAMSALFISGCASNVHLGYSPTILLQEQNSIPVSVKTFEDEREEREKIGVVRNLYGMPFSQIKTQDNVPEWVTNAFKTELARAGYHIAQDDRSSPYVLEGKIFEAYASSWLTYTGSVKVEIVLKKGQEIILQKTYDISEGNGMNFAMQTSSCVEALERSLQVLCRQFIDDVNHTIANANQGNSGPSEPAVY
jgi:uncharacterized lipoprotein YajG